MNNNLHYYLVTITELFGDKEVDVDVLVKTETEAQNNNIQNICEALAYTFRNGQEEDDLEEIQFHYEGHYWFFWEGSVEFKGYKEVPEEDYLVLKKYITELSIPDVDFVERIATVIS